jgi:endonuclease/exonuclease/phosphatase (EEP) superfamily protein YafD
VLTGHVLYPSLAKLLTTQGREPLTATPKIALLTYYAWPNEHQILLVTNIHAINFVTLKIFEMQLNQLEAILIQHPGPLILAGDFNTWHQQRLNLLHAMKTRLQLKSVFFKNKQAIKRVLLSPPLDHIFYRGLCQKQAEVLAHIVSSDHAPLWVEFTPLSQNVCLPYV